MADKQLKLQVLLGAVEKVTAPLKSITRGSENMAKAMAANRQKIKELERAQRDLASYRGMAEQSRNVAAALTAQQTKTRDLAAQMAAAGAPTKALSREYQQAVNASKKLESQHESLKSRLKPLANQLTAAGVKTSDFAREEFKLRSNLQSVTRELDKQKDAMGRAAAQQRKLTEAKAAYDKRMATAGKLAGTGAATTAGGAAMLYGGARFMGEGLSFDATMSNVQSLTRLDKNSEQLKALREQARQLGADTSFSAGDAASGQAFLAMAGFTPNAIRAAMPGLLDVARAGGTDLAITADIASNILSGMNLDPAKMGNVADVLVGTFTRSNTSLEMLGETMKYIAPVANSYHQSIETVLAATGKLGDAGIQGGQAGTALRAIMSRLAAPPAAAAAAIEELGIKTTDAAGNMRALPEILLDIHNATRNMGNAKMGGLLKAIAGEEAGSALTVLVGQAGTGALQEMIGTLKQAQGEAAKTAKIMGDNLKGDIDQLSSAWADLRIELFDGQNSGLRQLAVSLKDLIGDVSRWAKANPELTATIVKVTAAGAVMMVVFGSILTLIAGVLIPIAALKFALTVLGIKSFGLIAVLGKLKVGVLALGKALLMNPIGIAIAAIVALGAAVWWAWNNIEPFRNFMLTLWDGVTERWQAFVDGLRTSWSGGFISMLEWTTNLLVEFNPLALLYKGFAAVINWLGGDLPTSFKGAGAALIDGLIAGFTSQFPSLSATIGGAAESVKGWFKDVLGINSPSRVFAEYGINTLQGFENGIDSEQGSALRRVRDFAGAAAAAGAGILMSGSALAIDSRPPLSPANYSHAITGTGNTYNIYITPPAGTDPHAIAQEVDRILRQREAEQQRQQRGALSDRYSL